MRFNLNSILICLMYGTIVVDMMTGALLLNNPNASFTPGLFYKLILLLLLYYYLPRLGVQVVLANFLLISATFLTSLMTGLYSLSSNIIAITKLLMFVTFFHYLIYQCREGFINQKVIYKIAVFTFFVIVINQILGLIGFGKPTYYFYGTPVGTSGFFFEHNATGIVLSISVAIIYLHIRNVQPFKKTGLFLLISILIGFSFATKTAIVGTLIIAFIGLFEKKKKYLPFIIAIIVVIIIANWTIIQNTGQIAKVLDDVDKNSSEGLLSGRAVRLADGIEDYFFRFSIVEKITGIGNYRILNDLNLGDTAETDYIDILKMSGFIGFYVVFVPFVWITLKCAQYYRKYKNADFAVVVFLNIVFLGISSTAGHLFTSGSVNFYLALFNVYPFMSLLVSKQRAEELKESNMTTCKL